MIKNPRLAYTLLEMMIVLVIIAALFAIAWPRMRGMSKRAALREAAVDLKIAMGDARDEAVRSGHQVKFAYRTTASRLPDASATDVSDSDVSNADVSNRNQAGPSAIKLPYGISYAAKSELSPDEFGESNPDANVPIAMSAITNVPYQGMADPSSFRSSDSLHYVTFFPDGRSTAAEIYLRADDSREMVTLSVRALTGGVKIGPVLRPDPRTENEPTSQGLNDPGLREAR